MNQLSQLQETRIIEFPTKFSVGMRIHCSLYGGSDGTIIAVHGEQLPGTVRQVGGFGFAGGRAFIDVAWDTRGERGGYSKHVPESIARGVQWKMLSGYRDPAEAIAEADAYIAMEEAKKQAAARAFEQGKERVKKDYPFLTVDDGSDRNIIQKNLRALLKKEFPGVKFKVTKRDYSARSVNWVDGPTVSEVKKFTSLFEEGRFNGMEDIYEYEATPFNKVFGGCQYVFEGRSYSESFIQKAIDAVWEKWGSGFDCEEKPTVELYKKGGLRSIRFSNSNQDFADFVWKQLSEQSE